jgi:hypothetical protein
MLSLKEFHNYYIGEDISSIFKNLNVCDKNGWFIDLNY